MAEQVDQLAALRSERDQAVQADRKIALLRDAQAFHAARADLLRRLGRRDEAIAAYRAALARVTHPAERRFLERRLAGMSG